MAYFIQAALLTLAEALCCRICCETFLEQRFVGKKTVNRLLFVLLFAGFMGIALFASANYIRKAFLAVAVVFAVALIQYRNSVLKIFFVSAGYYSMVLCIDRIMLIVFENTRESGIENLLRDPVKGTVFALTCKAVLFLTVAFLDRWFKPKGSLNLIEDKEWVRFLFFPIITVTCMTAFAMEENESSDAVLTASFALLFSDFLIFYMIRDIVKREQNLREMQVTKERVKNRMAMYAYMEGVFEEQRKKTHEYKNQMECLKGLLEAGNYEEAVRYIREMNDGWVRETDCINTNHAIVNSILNQKYKQAKSLGIPIAFYINDLSGVMVSDEDLVLFLGNLLDNAIEACEKIKEGDKVIKFCFKKEGSRITILVRNPVSRQPEAVGGRLETSKSNPWEHGIGMSNIQSVVGKYGGDDIWSCNDGYFTHTIVIEM